jgi:hypothetical protein
MLKGTRRSKEWRRVPLNAPVKVPSRDKMPSHIACRVTRYLRESKPDGRAEGWKD